MKTYKQQLLDEGMGLDLMAELIPKRVLHYFKRVLHKDKYILALKIHRNIMRDATRSVSKEMALIKAAGVVGISPRELRKVMDKGTRHA